MGELVFEKAMLMSVEHGGSMSTRAYLVLERALNRNGAGEMNADCAGRVLKRGPRSFQALRGLQTDSSRYLSQGSLRCSAALYTCYKSLLTRFQVRSTALRSSPGPLNFYVAWAT